MRAIGLASAVVVASDATSGSAPAGSHGLGELDCAKYRPHRSGTGAIPEEAWGVYVLIDRYEDGSKLPGTGTPLLVPVLSMFAGRESGSQFLPRIGTEVYLRYVDDHPEQPVIIGFAHNTSYTYPFPPDGKDLPLVPYDEDGVSQMRHYLVVEEEESGEEEPAEEEPEQTGPPEDGAGAAETGADDEAAEGGAEDDGAEEEESPEMDVPATVADINEQEAPDDAADSVPTSDDAQAENYDIAPGTPEPLDVKANGGQITALTSHNGRNHILFEDALPQVVLKADNTQVTFARGDYAINVRGDMNQVSTNTETLHMDPVTTWTVGKHHTRIDGTTTIKRQAIAFSFIMKGQLHIHYGETNQLWGGIRVEIANEVRWTLTKPDIMAIKAIGQIILTPAYVDNQTTRMRLAVLRKHKTDTMERTSDTNLKLTLKEEAKLDELTRDVKLAMALAKEETAKMGERTKMGLLQLKIEKAKKIQ